MHRNKSVDVHQFAMIPKAEIPRSSFRMQKALKTTIGGTFGANNSRLYPILCEEILPGDTWNLRMTAFARLATPLFPIMDNMYLDSFFFFVPNRLVWDNWQKFMGERSPNPTSSISYTIPQVVSPVDGWDVPSLGAYFGLPVKGQVVAGNTTTSSALPFRAYNLIYNEWFRSQDISNSVTVATGDGPDSSGIYGVLNRYKRHDYFTSCLPWPLKGGVEVSIPLGSYAPIVPGLAGVPANVAPTFKQGATVNQPLVGAAPSGAVTVAAGVWPGGNLQWDNPSIYADLSTATAATINQLRQSFQIQRLLERDARGGTRYTEIIRAHFGVVSPDARLQRPEYLGGGSTPIAVNPIAQTSATGLTGGSTPTGNLSAMATGLMVGHGFTQSFVEHGYVIGLLSYRADLTYQQGLRRHWSRLTRYDYYFPAFAFLGEQAVLSKEIYADGGAGDNNVFGYQERWAEYRYMQSEVTGLFNSRAAGTIDPWHLAQNFASRPSLNEGFLTEAPPISRIVAVGAGANGQQFLVDCFFDVTAARPLPMYSVPGLIDHF